VTEAREGARRRGEGGQKGETESNSFADALTAAGVTGYYSGRAARCSSRTLNQILIKRNREMIFHYQLYAGRHRSLPAAVRCPGEIKFDSLSFSSTCRQLRRRWRRPGIICTVPEFSALLLFLAENFGMESQSRGMIDVVTSRSDRSR